MSISSNHRAKVIRNNISSVLRLSVKSVIDRSCFDHLDDQTPEVINFCNIVENMFYFAVKEPKRHPWKLILNVCQKLPHNCVKTIQSMEHLRHEYAKVRAWIRMSLMEKRFHEYLAEVVSHREMLKQYYTDESVLLSSEITSILNTTIGLSALDFSFDLRNNDLSYPGFVPIDYTPYLRFIQSPESILGDLLECQGHISNEELCPWKTKYVRLESKLKASNEQKSFLEETVNRLDCRVTQLQAEKRRSMAFMLQLEKVINDLRIHLTFLHEQYKTDMIHYCNSEPYVPPLPKIPLLPSVRELFSSRPVAESFSEHFWDPSSDELLIVTPIVNAMDNQQEDNEAIEVQQYTSQTVTYRSPSNPNTLLLMTGKNSIHRSLNIPKNDIVTVDVATQSLDLRRPRRSVSMDHDLLNNRYRTSVTEDYHQRYSTGPPTPEILRRLRRGELADSAYYQLSTDQDGLSDDENSPSFCHAQSSVFT